MSKETEQEIVDIIELLYAMNEAELAADIDENAFCEARVSRKKLNTEYKPMVKADL